ncbi:unnamed protein product [Chondrus crispus]|uniref:Uncharacterized protein n=1 Tax=Chondrus crispus TaxID=2769 RepID=R7QDP7_CHOCR|nr:unnamed protein product [Chondrus crispus]CDF36214.1 unnamed protein product [Chondrus crispus]|eukprot:XP_005716033.1 unnamed protein product [Chondrus crispus]
MPGGVPHRATFGPTPPPSRTTCSAIPVLLPSVVLSFFCQFRISSECLSPPGPVSPPPSSDTDRPSRKLHVLCLHKPYPPPHCPRPPNFPRPLPTVVRALKSASSASLARQVTLPKPIWSSSCLLKASSPSRLPILPTWCAA